MHQLMRPPHEGIIREIGLAVARDRQADRRLVGRDPQ